MTGEHPFWVKGKGWVGATFLEVGDLLSSHDGQWVPVEAVNTDDRKVTTVYNLRVAEYHTYFVGCQEWGFSVWAHNLCNKAQFMDAMLNEGFSAENAGKAWSKYKLDTATPDWAGFKNDYLLKKQPSGLNGRLKNRPYELTDAQADNIINNLKATQPPAPGAPTSLSPWQQHEVNVTNALKASNPGVTVGEQIELQVTNKLTGQVETIRIDNLVAKPGGAVLVDAKHSVNTNLTTGSLKSRLTESQQNVFGWLADPKVGSKNLSFVPVGANAAKAKLTVGKPIKVTGIEIHVENSATGGITARQYP